MIKNLANFKGVFLTQELTKHFGYLLPNTNWEPVLLAIMEQVLSVKIIKGSLILHFSGKRILTATSGIEEKKYQDWPQSFQNIVKHHEHLTFPDESWGITLGESPNFEPHISTGEALEYYEKDIPLLAPITNYSDWMVYHPDEKTTTGGSVLCNFDHGTCDFGKRTTHNIGAVFLMLIAQALELKLDFPSAPKIKTEDNTAHLKWWKALSPAWKNFLRNEFELEELNEDALPSEKDIKQKSRLNIGGHKDIIDPTPLLKFTGLKKLSIPNSGISNFTFLTQLKKLKALDFDTRNIKDLSPLKGLTKLQKLSLIETKAVDLSPLKNLTNLKTLHLRNTEITDLNPLKKLTKLQSLGIVATKISDLSPLQNYRQLKVLYLNASAITNIDALSNCTQLEDLALSDTKVQDISALAQLENISELDISKTEVTSLIPLYNLKKLKRLNIQNTTINLKEILSFLTTVPNCYLHCNYYRDAELAKAALLKLESIIGVEQEYAAFIFKILNSLSKKNNVANSETYRLLTHFVQFLPISIKGDLQQKLLTLSLDILMSTRTKNKEINTEEVEIKMLEYLLPDELNNDELAYNLALCFARQNNKEKVILFTKKALGLGIEQQCFIRNIDAKTGTTKEDINKILALTQFNNIMLEVNNLLPLKHLTKLKKIRLWEGNYTSLEPLSELSNLEEIELSHKKNIPDLSPLTKLIKLKKIKFFQSQVSEEQIAAFKKARPEIEVE